MLLRSTFGILALAAFVVSASASLVSYRVTGTFDQATEDYAPLLGTQFTYDFTYDTGALNLGDEYSAAYELVSTDLSTALGDLHTKMGDPSGAGVATIDLDPEVGSVGFGAFAMDDLLNQHVYGIVFGDLSPQSGDLPTDVAAFAQDHKGTFFLTGLGPARFSGTGSAFANVTSVQAVPEPASLVALSAGALALLRRRRASA